jgi:hypothetical protein
VRRCSTWITPALATALAACRPWECGPGTVEVDRACLAAPRDTVEDEPVVDPAVDSDAPDTVDSDTVDTVADTPAPEETDVAPPDAPLHAFFGDVVFDDADGMSAFCSEHDRVYGDVQIRGDRVTNLTELACLRRVVGTLTLTGDDLAVVDLPALADVTGDLKVVGGPQLSLVRFDQLTDVGGHLRIGGGGEPLSALLGVDLPALIRVGVDLWLDDTVHVPSLTLPSLTTVGRHLWVRRHREMTALSLPQLTGSGGALRLEMNPALSTLDLPALRYVGGDSVGELAIQDNGSLSSLRPLHDLTRVGGSFIVRRNASLPTPEAEALRDAIGVAHIDGPVVIEGNAAVP